MVKEKNPGLAAVLSFLITGLGQAYNGDFLKMLGLWFAALISGLLVFVGIGIILLPIVWLAGVGDAYVSATRHNQRIEK